MIRWFIIFILLSGCGGGSASNCEIQNIVLQNEAIEVHLSTAGGSISHVSTIGGQNLINNQDLGRQIQQSFYAGEDQVYPDQHPAWTPWPWNIIQTGDVYGNKAPMTVQFQSDTRAVIMSTPMRWDRNNEPEYCATLINDITLINSMVRVHVSLVLSYECEIVNPIPHHQEMPAVYTAGNLDVLISGDNEIKNDKSIIWAYWEEPENWAGAYGSDGQGIAVYMDQAELFVGGRYENGMDHTTYFAPLKTLTLKPGDTLNYTYWIIVGTVQDIKDFIRSIQ